jgi:hypothetical protein
MYGVGEITTQKVAYIQPMAQTSDLGHHLVRDNHRKAEGIRHQAKLQKSKHEPQRHKWIVRKVGFATQPSVFNAPSS